MPIYEFVITRRDIDGCAEPRRYVEVEETTVLRARVKLRLVLEALAQQRGSQLDDFVILNAAVLPEA